MWGCLVQCDLCDYKQIVLSYCDHRGTAVKTQGGGCQGDRPQKEPVLGVAMGVACLLSALWNFPSGCTGLDRLGFLIPRCGGSGCWLFQLSRGNSPPSVSRDGGACLGTAGVTQSLKGGLN